MAEINCPNCGMMNAADAVYCWYCQKPMNPSRKPSKAEAAKAEPVDDTPDWLNKIRQKSQEERGQPDASWMGAAAEEDENVPDWLRDIKSGGEPAPAAPAEEPQIPGFPPETEPSAPALATPAAGAETEDDWMARLSDWKTPAAPAAEPGPAAFAAEPPAEAEPAVEMPSWLDDLAAPAEPQQTPPAAAPVAAAALSTDDWLASLRAEETPAAPPAGETPAAPDWTSTFQSNVEPPAQPAAAAEMPDWMSQLTSNEAPAQPAAETPDWLGTLQQGGEEPPAQPAAAAEMPDWMSRMGNDEAPAQPAAETPDWLGTLQTEQPAKPAAADDNDDWLNKLRGFGMAEESAPAASSMPAAPGDFGKVAEAPQAPAEPDWLNELNRAPQNFEEPAPPAAAPLTPAPAFELPEGTEMPDWLTGMAPVSSAAPAAADQSAAFAFQQEQAAPQAGDDAALPFAASDLPDWLSAAAAESSAAAAATGVAGGEGTPESLEVAQLPNWLQAMRPVEAVVPSQRSAAPADSRTETSGPLAGYTGVLPGSELVQEFSRPPVYSTKLRVTEQQRIEASLLENLIVAETQPAEVQPRSSHMTQRLFRLIIGMVMVILLIIPLIFKSQTMPIPTEWPKETIAMYNSIQAIPENAPVLLVVDYEPSLSGEMQAAAQSMVEHLMARNTRITLVSSVSEGPVLGQSLLTAALVRQPMYQIASQTANLGYLPGGSAGLQAFAQNPVQTARYGFDLQDAWQTNALQGITSLNNFSAVIVIADNLETARAWIEQVQPSLGTTTPMLMVASAQAAPLLQPYFASGQIKGLVGGLAGGLAYESIHSSPGTAYYFWDAYETGLSLAIVLILVGGLLRLVTLLRSRTKGQ